MSDIGHSRVLSKSQLIYFSAPSRCVFTVGCHVLLSFNILYLACLWRSPLVAKRCGRESPGCKYTSLALKKNMKGYPLAIHVHSKKLVAFKLFYSYCLFIRFDLPINEPVFRKVSQREKVSLLQRLSGRIFLDELCFCQKRCTVW